MVLLDREKAFHQIFHAWLSRALQYFEIPEEILGMVKALYKNPQFYVELEGTASKIAEQERGIRQVCPLSPYLFIMVMDRIFEVIPHVARTHGRK